MTLYHFTAPYQAGHLGGILRDGRIKTTDSNADQDRARAAPDIVWLTDEPNPYAHDWTGDPAETNPVKLLGRITVEVSDALSWESFCARFVLEDAWRASLERFGNVRSWYVLARPIPATEWVAVEHRLPSGPWRPVTAWTALPANVDDLGVPGSSVPRGVVRLGTLAETTSALESEHSVSQLLRTARQLRGARLKPRTDHDGSP